MRGIHRSPVNSPHKGQWRGALRFSLICAWINDRVNNREAGDLRRYRAHYDVIVMCFYYGKIWYFLMWFLCSYTYTLLHWHVPVKYPTNIWMWSADTLPQDMQGSMNIVHQFFMYFTQTWGWFIHVSASFAIKCWHLPLTIMCDCARFSKCIPVSNRFTAILCISGLILLRERFTVLFVHHAFSLYLWDIKNPDYLSMQ